MRNGSTSQEASEAVMQDVEMMSKEIIPDKKKLTTTGPPIQAGKGKNSKGYKGKGACRWSPYHIPLTRSLESTAGVLVVRSSKQLVGWPRSSSQQSPSCSWGAKFDKYIDFSTSLEQKLVKGGWKMWWCKPRPRPNMFPMDLKRNLLWLTLPWGWKNCKFTFSMDLHFCKNLHFKFT